MESKAVREGSHLEVVLVTALIGCLPPLAILLIASPAKVEGWEGLRLAYGLFFAIAAALVTSPLGGFFYAGSLPKSPSRSPGNRRVETGFADMIVATILLIFANIGLLILALFLLRLRY